MIRIGKKRPMTTRRDGHLVQKMKLNQTQSGGFMFNVKKGKHEEMSEADVLTSAVT